MSLTRFSSRRERLDTSFLTPRLAGARGYDRIAGYFSSSMLEIAGEALESVSGPVRIVCNSDLNPQDVATAQAAKSAIRREWCASLPEALGADSRGRFARLYQFLATGKLKVKVLPNQHFGLIHGKAGVITLADGRKTSFMGSVNESVRGWQLNYELLWEDESEEAVAWVQEEFNALWHSPHAVELAEFVIEDIQRLAQRTVIHSVSDWRKNPSPAAAIIESPVYRREVGLWDHQKYFVKLAFDAHQGPFGARFILADQVGLGKTLQLALSAELMALADDKPVLVLAPKPLLWQWQGELKTLLDMPSAVWNGRQWVDEQGIEYPIRGASAIRNCPRRVGIVSTGLAISRSATAEWLTELDYACVILDEAHRARRLKLSRDREYDDPSPNNLLAFIQRIAERTKSLLLATATPVQLHPVEVWDLLEALNRGADSVLGAPGSRWRDPRAAIEMIMGQTPPPGDDQERWDWLRNPFPPAAENREFALLRRALRLENDRPLAPGKSFGQLRPPDRDRFRRLFLDDKFFKDHNPFIRHIVCRTREYLETTLNPETGEPYLKPVKVKLHGEAREDAIQLPPFLNDAYQHAEEFCRLLGQRMKSGFLKTLMLRRAGSTLEAGRITAENMLNGWDNLVEEEESDEFEEGLNELPGKYLLPPERECLERYIRALEHNQDRDPKYQAVIERLKAHKWLDLGCIIFSQYYDSVWWLANQLAGELPGERIAIYAGMQRSGLMVDGVFTRLPREAIKAMVSKGELRLLLGTDAAAEGLNLQRLGTLINLDLPWNPSRLEQRKGRIQRIGQFRDTVDIFNMRYKDSVEDRVHAVLSERLSHIATLFGQIPDILEDVWISEAMGDKDRVKQTLDSVPQSHPFELRYHRIEKVSWEACATVLDAGDRRAHLRKPWSN